MLCLGNLGKSADYIMNIIQSPISLVIVLFILLVAILNFLYLDKSKSKIDNLSFIFVLFLFVSLVFIRNGMVTDEISYLKEYKEFGTRPFYFGFSFYIVNYLMYLLNLSDAGFLIFMPILYGVLSLCFVFKFIKDGERTIVLLFLLFTYHAIDFYFNIYRQGLASIFLLFAFCFYKEKKIVRAIFFVVIASGFHWASPVPVLCVILSKYLTRRTWIFFAILLLFMLLLTFYNKIGIIGVVNNALNYFPFFSESKFYKAFNAYYLLSFDSDYSLYSMSYYGRLPLLFMIISFGVLLFFMKVRDSFFLLLIGYSILMVEIPYPIRNFYFVFSFLPCVVILSRGIISEIFRLRMLWLYFITCSLLSLTFSPVWLMIFR